VIAITVGLISEGRSGQKTGDILRSLDISERAKQSLSKAKEAVYALYRIPLL
jgi:hypothetical protein